MAAIDAMLDRMKEADASDLHLKAGVHPRYRVRGELVSVPGSDPMDAARIEAMVREILSEEQARLLAERGEIDFAYGLGAAGRYRCNAFRDHFGWAAVCRRIPSTIPTLAGLHLPANLESLVHRRSGLILVTGPTGSGKTSTLAALIDLINRHYRKHVVTLEDPIEYVHENRRSVIHQRGLNYDITGFAEGIRDALREDPDVLLIGEMRDLETIRMALTAAEVGALVFATLHTNGAAETIDRIIDVFPGGEQPQVRAMLSQSLVGVVSQVLLARLDGAGRLPAVEVLFATPAVGNLVRENKVAEIMNVLQAGKALGMRTLDDSLLELVTKGLVAPEEALPYARQKASFESLAPHALR